ncbi:MAG: metal-dependent hydrolase [Polyangiaceae bacterium]|nr:metal-dependent hydrolase [Polyangiaceae bacterium]
MQTATESRPSRPARTPLRPRRLDLEIDAESVPAAWWNDDLILSLFGDSLSLVFPVGERFFVDSVRRYRKQITDEQLLDDINGFTGQEVLHSKAHQTLNDLFEAHGLKSAREREAHVGRLLDRVRKLPPILQLAATCALEHMTALLGEQLLELSRELDDVNPKLRPLWLWHAIEESEHKAVAFDVYETVGGGYVIRTGVMVAATIIFIAEMVHIHATFARDKGVLLDLKGWGRALGYLWGRPGILRRLVPGYFHYFRPGFHPNDRDTTSLLDQWRGQLFTAPTRA